MKLLFQMNIYIYKYAYYYKNINIVIQWCILFYDTETSIYYDSDDTFYTDINVFFIEYLKKKHSKLYKDYANYFVNSKKYNFRINHLDDLDILNLYYKYNGKINMYDMCKKCRLHTNDNLYVKYIHGQYNYHLYDSFIKCKNCNFNCKKFDLNIIFENKLCKEKDLMTINIFIYLYILF